MTPAPSRRRLLLAGAGFAAASASGNGWARADTLALSGRRTQGGVLIGRTAPGAPLALDGAAIGEASPTGLFVIGFDRDAGPTAELSAYAGGAWTPTRLEIAPVAYEVQRIDGLPPQMVTPTDPDVVAREARDYSLKEKAFASRAPIEDFKDGFAPPLEAPVRTSPFGVQRVLNGEPKTPHYGVDLAAPVGAPILAPCGGLVVLAAPDLYLDGGLTLIDHGQGLISAYLHQSEILVAAGDRVRTGAVIGKVGMKGRATGPHLCWRLKWRGRNLDPSLFLGVRAPLA